MRVLHFSDVHVGIPLSRVPLRRWLSKRALGAANLVLRRRGRRFARASAKLAALAELAHREAVDLVIFSGDYTALGLEEEYAAARLAVEPLMRHPRPYFSLPGNHDLYVADTVRERLYERHFADTLTTDLPVPGATGAWPVVRLIGDDVAVIGVQGARPTAPWSSSGRIPSEQLAALERLAHGSLLEQRFTFLVTHYAPRLADGGPDTRRHGLENADELLRASARLTRGAILCGHVHHPYLVRVPETALPIVCAGSATLEGRESFWLFEVEPDGCRAIPGRWAGDRYRLDEREHREIWRPSFDSPASLQQA